MMHRVWTAIAISGVLMVPVVLTRTRLLSEGKKAARTYHDTKHNDYHEWNSHEDQAFRAYAAENHRGHSDFSRLKEDDQQAYWDWRHTIPTRF